MMQKPEKVDQHAVDGETMYAHPAYGMIRASRISCRRVSLFGSELPVNACVRVEILQAVSVHRGADSPAYGRDTIVEVLLSESQWLQFISGCNGAGTHCTLDRVGAATMPDLPAPPKPQLEIEAENEAEMAALLDQLDQLHTTIVDVGLPKKKSQLLLDRLQSVKHRLQSTTPYLIERFQARLERMVASAKAEIAACRSAGSAETPSASDLEDDLE